MDPKISEPEETTLSARIEDADVAETSEEDREFDEVLERAAPRLAGMAARARRV